ncbi:EAL domain-containing protein [Marinomonas pontica]|uniref:EAL domain-containing protein n=1 Tax=Marinomonas pontica TaxID=264739 RepID=UPI0022440A99|nr:EAL domain-containing protein [Marinomonas pontica]MCW8357102.1 EAL domain-containing protein [Marinomonas pontica]
MNLNKRLVLLLFPIILFGYGIATFFVYQYQKSSVIELEQAKLEQRMFQLQSVFKEESSAVDNAMALFLEGGYLSDFLTSASSSYRDIALSQGLNVLTSQILSNKPNSRLSFALYNGSGDELFYYERSADPFATISNEQFGVTQKMIAHHITSSWELFHNSSDISVVKGRLLDRVALLPFKGRDINDSVQLSFAVRMDQFSEYLATLEQSYNATLVWSNQILPVENVFAHSIQLSPNQFLTIKPNASVLARPLLNLRIQLIFVAFFLGVITYGLLIYLISRFITAPISALDNELTQVMEYQKENISPTESRSEIGQLSKKFYVLFEQLQNNLKKTHEMAITDTLTSLPNRFRFYEYAKSALIKAEQDKRFVSLIYIDLDNFKFVNDKLGHEAGDDLLCFLANDLQRLIKPILQSQGGCMVSRLSGDEFAIVLTHKVAVDEADDLAQSVVALFERGYQSDHYYFPVSASMGIATYPADGHNLKELIANADMAMYNAKRSGKNRYKHYSENIASAARRTKSIETQLKMIDCDKEFSLVYMPYTSANMQIKGFEVLIRWHSAELGEIHPDEFIPIAEQTGTYAKIDHWVFETAFKSLPKIRDIFGEECVLSINISAAELGHHVVLDRLIELKEQYGIEDKSIELELTETFSYVQTSSVFDVLNGLQKAGFSIAIDDFGVGYTPLLHMIDYPVDKVKLDKVLTERVTNPEYAKLLPALIELCHLQDIVVTAEGIENTSQYKNLREAGCDFFQGYWLSKPMTLDELENWYYVYSNKGNL